MTRVYVNDGSGRTYEAGETLVIGQAAIFHTDGTLLVSTADSLKFAGVVSGASNKGLFQSDGITPRATDTIYDGESATVRQTGTVEMTADSSHSIVPGIKIKLAGTGKVIEAKISAGDTADMIIGYAVSEVDSDKRVLVHLY
jgi:hypothetical protein